ETDIIVFIRIICVPIYMTLVILSSKPAYESNKYLFLFLGLGIMIFAALTDVVDGKIARKYKAGTKFGKHVVKYDQGTYLGQCLDPIADKLMHVGALVALTIAGYLHWVFIALLVLREACMIIVGSFMVNDINIKANMMGKVASATLSVGIILSFFHTWLIKLWAPYSIDWIIVTIGLVLNWVAAINYAKGAAKQVKAKKAADKANNQKNIEETEEK
ncbi:MAG TPA: CDP-alcohol phosphatidyltransferase family protein, partial [Clostridia bacterium]|nr:CDP-alcohol phosphatidyltransferase family protein [Clostridia bacterium]